MAEKNEKQRSKQAPPKVMVSTEKAPHGYTQGKAGRKAPDPMAKTQRKKAQCPADRHNDLASVVDLKDLLMRNADGLPYQFWKLKLKRINSKNTPDSVPHARRSQDRNDFLGLDNRTNQPTDSLKLKNDRMKAASAAIPGDDTDTDDRNGYPSSQGGDATLGMMAPPPPPAIDKSSLERFNYGSFDEYARFAQSDGDFMTLGTEAPESSETSSSDQSRKRRQSHEQNNGCTPPEGCVKANDWSSFSLDNNVFSAVGDDITQAPLDNNVSLRTTDNGSSATLLHYDDPGDTYWAAEYDPSNSSQNESTFTVYPSPDDLDNVGWWTRLNGFGIATTAQSESSNTEPIRSRKRRRIATVASASNASV